MTEASLHEEMHIKIGGVLKEAVFGFNDGVVSTFAVIAGLTGGAVEQKTILLAALATLFAGAFSMGLGTYIGSKSEKELYESERRRELYEMKHVPEVERQEIRDIYAAKGFQGKLLEDVVVQITSNPEVWLKTMMTEELGFADEPPKPGMNGVVMSMAFVTGSLIPTVPYFFKHPALAMPVMTVSTPLIFMLSLGFSAFGLLLVGGLKTKFTKKNLAVSALESLLVGSLAAGGAYGIGVLLG